MSQQDTDPLFEVRLPDPPEPTAFEREKAAFFRLMPGLLATHRGQYIVVHNEQVVDSGPDDAQVTLRVLRRLGKVPIYVGLVAEAQPVYRIPHYREARTGAAGAGQ